MIILVGPPGCGGEEILAELAGRGLTAVASDELTEQQLGMEIGEAIITGRDIAAAQASAALAALASGSDAVLLGSGTLGESAGDEKGRSVRERVEQLLDSGATKVWLDAAAKVLMHRAGLDAPRSVAVGSPRASYLTMYQRRTPLYEHRARRIDTGSSDWPTIAETILTAAGTSWD